MTLKSRLRLALLQAAGSEVRRVTVTEHWVALYHASHEPNLKSGGAGVTWSACYSWASFPGILTRWAWDIDQHFPPASHALETLFPWGCQFHVGVHVNFVPRNSIPWSSGLQIRKQNCLIWVTVWWLDVKPWSFLYHGLCTHTHNYLHCTAPRSCRCPLAKQTAG